METVEKEKEPKKDPTSQENKTPITSDPKGDEARSDKTSPGGDDKGARSDKSPGNENGGGPKAEGDAPDSEDISEMLNLLNEVDKNAGGKGEFSDIPAEYRGVIKKMFSYMLMVDKLVNDPAYKAAIEDVYDQEADGKTPSFEVAVARTMDLDRLKDISENENFDEIQSAVAEGNESREKESARNAEIMANYDKSIAAGNEYADEMGYDETERQELFKFFFEWFKILGDGNITRAEWEKGDKMRNYDSDLADAKAQAPDDAVKEVLPDKASMETAREPKPVEQYNPRNSMESMAANSVGTDITDVGRRKRKY